MPLEFEVNWLIDNYIVLKRRGASPVLISQTDGAIKI